MPDVPQKHMGIAVDASVGAETPEPPTEMVVAAANSRSFEKKAADLVCTGTNDEAVLNEAIARLTYGGTLRLADGDYFIDAFPNEGNSAIFFGYNEGLTRVVTVKGTTESKIYGACRGAALHVTKRAMDVMAPDGVYRVFFAAGRIPEGPGDTYTYTHVNNVNFTNFRILFHDASKPLIGIDGRHFGSMELDLVGVYTERYFPDRYEHLKPATPAKGSIGVYSLPGGWSGFLSYTLQGTAYGLGTGNWNPARFWREGSGLNIRTFDFNASVPACGTIIAWNASST